MSYDAPFLSVDVSACLRPALADSSVCRHMDQWAVTEPYIGWFDAFFATRPDIAVINQSAIFASGSSFTPFDPNGQLMMRDNHHLSYLGSDLAAQRFLRRFGPNPAAGAAHTEALR